MRFGAHDMDVCGWNSQENFLPVHIAMGEKVKRGGDDNDDNEVLQCEGLTLSFCALAVSQHVPFPTWLMVQEENFTGVPSIQGIPTYSPLAFFSGLATDTANHGYPPPKHSKCGTLPCTTCSMWYTADRESILEVFRNRAGLAGVRDTDLCVCKKKIKKIRKDAPQIHIIA